MQDTTDTPTPNITEALELWRQGSSNALNEMMPMLEAELRRIARGRLIGLRTTLRPRGVEPTIETAGLINETYLRLVKQRSPWQNRAHFFGVTAKMMRHICIDYIRRENAAKRAGGVPHVALDTLALADEAHPAQSLDLIALDRALGKLEALDERQSRIVELKFFAGLTAPEIAEVLSIGERTVKREWSVARAWLYRELDESAS